MKSSKVIAKTLLRDSDGKLLLLRRSETDVRRPNQWDFPGGNVEAGEDFVTAAIRETVEESGITVSGADLHLSYTTAEMTEFGNICWLFFMGQVDKPTVTLSSEHSEYIWVTLAEAIEMITYERQRKALVHIQDNKLFED